MKLIMTLTLAFIIAACARKEDSADDAINDLDSSVESAVTKISALPDEQTGASFVANQRSFPVVAGRAGEWLLPKAWASNCSRPASLICSSGVKTETYTSCDLPYSARTMTGTATLTYSDASCDMSAVGASVQRTYEVILKGLYGGELTISSNTHTDFRGNSIGGGGRLTRTSGGWEVEVLGQNNSFIRRGRELFSISSRTTSPLVVTGSLARAARVINGGALEIIHNKSQFVATYVPNSLQWISTCCHPVAGSLAVTYSGSVSGSATVTFNSCGSATLEKDGLSRQISFNYCE